MRRRSCPRRRADAPATLSGAAGAGVSPHGQSVSLRGVTPWPDWLHAFAGLVRSRHRQPGRGPSRGRCDHCSVGRARRCGTRSLSRLGVDADGDTLARPGVADSVTSLPSLSICSPARTSRTIGSGRPEAGGPTEHAPIRRLTLTSLDGARIVVHLLWASEPEHGMDHHDEAAHGCTVGPTGPQAHSKCMRTSRCGAPPTASSPVMQWEGRRLTSTRSCTSSYTGDRPRPG